MLKELLYPFDSSLILSKRKKLKKELLQQPIAFIEKNIAILGGSTTNDIKVMLELFLLNSGIKANFYESEYNKYYEDAVFQNPELEAFNPDIIYIHTTNRNITRFPTLNDTDEDIDMLFSQQMEKFETIWTSLSEKYSCVIIQNNFELPYYRLMGNKEAFDIHGAVNYVTRLNMSVYEYAQKHDNFYICDINYLSADYGLKEWADPFYYHMYKYALNVNAIPSLAFNVANIIKSVLGKNKKGMVIDLDNTLWGGVIGDDGVENISIGPENSESQAFSEFQRYIKQQKQLGVVLAIDSKNEYENAISGLNHPGSELSPDDFVSIKANWDPKDKNFAEIARELSLLPESLVFIDDNPAERHIVSEQLPGVVAPQLNQINDYITNIDRGGYFEVTTLSEDDRKRNQMYKENIARQQLQSKFSDYGEYLASLEMHASIRGFEQIYFARIAQLSNKSNQFNLTTRRYTQAEIEDFASNENYITLYGKLEDRFGDNGVVSVVIAHADDSVCHVDLWLMSCRVLKRDLEFAMMDALAAECRKRNIKTVFGYYYPTKKNAMVREFYSTQGFNKIEEDSDGNSTWKLELNDYKDKNKYIKIEE